MSYFTGRVCCSVISKEYKSREQCPYSSILLKSVQRGLKMYQELIEGGKDHVILFLATEAPDLVVTK